MRKRVLALIIMSITLLTSEESQSQFTGNANFYYISKLSDGNIIRLPYRMLNTAWTNQYKNVELIGSLSIEYEPTTNNSFKMDDPQDFLLDLTPIIDTIPL